MLVCLALISWLTSSRPTAPVIAVHFGGAVAVAVVGTVATVADPAGIEATSVVLATIMVAVVVAVTRIRAGLPDVAEVHAGG